jgi:hypothetical protein
MHESERETRLKVTVLLCLHSAWRCEMQEELGGGVYLGYHRREVEAFCFLRRRLQIISSLWLCSRKGVSDVCVSQKPDSLFFLNYYK